MQVQPDGNHSAAQRLTRGDWCASRFTPLLAPSCCMSESEGTGCISALATCTGGRTEPKVLVDEVHCGKHSGAGSSC